MAKIIMTEKLILARRLRRKEFKEGYLDSEFLMFTQKRKELLSMADVE